jgi:hypothetical protein
VEAETDGVLLIRRLFTFSGPALTDNAVGDGCDRCTPEEIADYIDANLELFDVDGEGETIPLIDGLIVLRHLLGITGDALVAGAVDEDCVRCDPDFEIAPYIDTLLVP